MSSDDDSAPETTRKRSRSVLLDVYRKTRKKQRRLFQRLAPLDFRTHMEEVRAIRVDNNYLFDNHKQRVRERKLDANNVDLISVKYAQQAEYSYKPPAFDADRLARKLTDALTTRSHERQYFDYLALGEAAGVCFNKVPSVSFLAGALDHVVVVGHRRIRAERVVRQRYQPEVEYVRPESIKNDGTVGADQLSAMEKLAHRVYKTLDQREAEECCREDEPYPPLDGVRFLFNPQSFTQTVENIFTYSFLVKRGEAAIAVTNDRGLIVKQMKERIKFKKPTKDEARTQRAVTEEEEEEMKPPTPIAPKQAVCSFTMRDWRRMCRHLEQGDIKHRTGSKYARDSQSQNGLTEP